MSLTERIPVLVTSEQRKRLDRLAAREGRSVGAVVRAAIEAYTAPPSRSARAVLDDLYALEAPVGDWSTMKAEIIAGATGDPASEVLRDLHKAGQAGE
jgi:hypothetical protein